VVVETLLCLGRGSALQLSLIVSKPPRFNPFFGGDLQIVEGECPDVCGAQPVVCLNPIRLVPTRRGLGS